MSAELTQNELYKFQGDFAAMPEVLSLPVPEGDKGELESAAVSVRISGIHGTAARIDQFSNPVIRLYLRLLDEGMPASAVHSVARVLFRVGRCVTGGPSGGERFHQDVLDLFLPYTDGCERPPVSSAVSGKTERPFSAGRELGRDEINRLCEVPTSSDAAPAARSFSAGAEKNQNAAPPAGERCSDSCTREEALIPASAENELTQDDMNQLLGAISVSDPFPGEADSPPPEALIIEGDLNNRIDHSGPVRITGRLLPGGIINAKGPVTVDGGITGGLVKTVNGLTTPYIEYSVVTSFLPVLVTAHVLGSDILAVDGLYCSPNSGSSVIGGRCRSYTTIQADVIGSSLGLPTRVELVNRAPEYSEFLHASISHDPYRERIVALEGVRKGTEAIVYGVRHHIDKSINEPGVFPCFRTA